MTQIVGDHGLFCIDEHDYAAFALAMQCNAEAADAALSGFNTSLTGFSNRPWVSVVQVDSISVSTGSGFTGPAGAVGEIIDTEGTGSGTSAVTRNNFPATGPIPPGIWLVGSTIKWTFGALTANSYRELMIYAVPNIGGIVSSVNGEQIFQMRDYQGEAGATGALNTVGMIDTRAGNIQSFESLIGHGNAASAMAVAPNEWRLWATYLGSGVTF